MILLLAASHDSQAREGSRKVNLRGDWQLQSSVLAGDAVAEISTPGFAARNWLPTTVPATVLKTLIDHGVYPDPRIGLNSFKIPDSSDAFNREHGLARFSHLPDKRNPWRDPYWYRTEFELEPIPASRQVWLQFNGINYRGEVWLNGQQIADHEHMAGMFQRFRFDISRLAKAGRNALAVKIFPVDHPGEPETQLEVLGKDRGYQKEIMKDVTEVMTVGYDCMGTVPDRNMGVVQEVFIEQTGPVPAGMNDKGDKTYSWTEPANYFRWVRNGRNWMFQIENGSPSVPPISSLIRFLPDLGQRSATTPFPLTNSWAHHDACSYCKEFDQALRRLLGEPESVADYCWKAQLLTADQHRAMHEAVNHRMWDVTSGFTQWKINATWPSVEWQIFDWYLKPLVSHSFIKHACEPVHVQLNLPELKVSVINRRLDPQQGLRVRARLLDLQSNLLWEKTVETGVAANHYQEVFDVKVPPGLEGGVYFVRLDLADDVGRPLSSNLYWLRAEGAKDYTALNTMTTVRLESTIRIEQNGEETTAVVRLTNPSERIALLVQLALTDGPTGDEILPAFWSDNCLSLLPGESREIRAKIPQWAISGKAPRLEVGGWNVASDFTCSTMNASPSEPKSGQAFDILATINRTFLDGSRIPLIVDGKTVASTWCWAREKPESLRFALTIDRLGSHRIQVGERSVTVDVK